MYKFIFVIAFFNMFFVINIYAFDTENKYVYGFSVNSGINNKSNYSYELSFNHKFYYDRLFLGIDYVQIGKEDFSYKGGELFVKTLGLVLWFDLRVGFLYGNDTNLTVSGLWYIPFVVFSSSKYQIPLTPYYKARYINSLMHECGIMIGFSVK